MAETDRDDPGTAGTRDYRLAPLMSARFLGAYLVLLAVLVFVATGLVAVFDLPADLLVVLLGLGLAGLFAFGAWLRSRVVLHVDDDGYRVRFVRGAGTVQARWNEVEDVVSASRHGAACLVLRLRSGATTTIPVAAVAGDPERLADDVRRRLQRR